MTYSGSHGKDGQALARMARLPIVVLIVVLVAMAMPQMIAAGPNPIPPPRPAEQGVTGSGSTPVVRQYGPVNGNSPGQPPPRPPEFIAVQPKTTHSYYVTQNDPGTFFQLGSDQGTNDQTNGGNQQNTIILDFGKPTCKPNPDPSQLPVPSACPATDSPFLGTGLFAANSPLITLPQTENMVNQFAIGYASTADAGSLLTIVVGTNNAFNPAIPSHQDADYIVHGRAWAQLIERINNDLSANGITSVNAIGGSDMEGGTGFNDAATTRLWVDAYRTEQNFLLVNYGDAAGCPRDNYTGPCNPGWSEQDVWYVSFGVGNALPFAEIYAEVV
ncbi:MAG: hypothetical protein ACR2M3_16085 [Thermomicrobiales bacterium]